MSFFLVFLAVVLVALVLWAGLGRRTRKSGELPALLDGGFDEPPANLPPVLLPEHAVPEDVTRLRFSLGLRGYRMDQVDQVLDELRDQLAARDAELAELRGRLAATERSEEQPVEQLSDAGSPSSRSAAPEGPGREEPGADPGAEGNPVPSVHENAAPGKGGL